MRRTMLLCALAIELGCSVMLEQVARAQTRPLPPLRSAILDLPVTHADSVAQPSELHAKSPLLAIGLSAVLPGAGQVYTHRYWTIPIIYGFGALFVYNWKEADKLYEQYRRDYAQSVEDGEYGGLGNPSLKSGRDFYRNERDRFGVYLLLTYLLNIADAYVGASLYGFNVSDDLGPDQELRVSLSLPLR